MRCRVKIAFTTHTAWRRAARLMAALRKRCVQTVRRGALSGRRKLSKLGTASPPLCSWATLAANSSAGVCVRAMPLGAADTGGGRNSSCTSHLSSSSGSCMSGSNFESGDLLAKYQFKSFCTLRTASPSYGNRSRTWSCGWGCVWTYSVFLGFACDRTISPTMLVPGPTVLMDAAPHSNILELPLERDRSAADLLRPRAALREGGDKMRCGSVSRIVVSISAASCFFSRPLSIRAIQFLMGSSLAAKLAGLHAAW
mmetsp:Transcript_76748/g.128997  ORF Transcript_76748/g.128997 Transcript_76748/m.128997 type:complete len:255 (-) Transcript_76748:1431-2195(-)